jgi:hypothetical protein
VTAMDAVAEAPLYGRFDWKSSPTAKFRVSWPAGGPGRNTIRHWPAESVVQLVGLVGSQFVADSVTEHANVPLP